GDKSSGAGAGARARGGLGRGTARLARLRGIGSTRGASGSPRGAAGARLVADRRDVARVARRIMRVAGYLQGCDVSRLSGGQAQGASQMAPFPLAAGWGPRFVWRVW